MAGFLWYPNTAGLNPSIWAPGGSNSHYACALPSLADPVYLHTLPITIDGDALDTSAAVNIETYCRYLFNGNSELALSGTIDAPNVLNLSNGNLTVTTIDEETVLPWVTGGTVVYEYPEVAPTGVDLASDNTCLVMEVQFAIFDPLVASTTMININGADTEGLYLQISTDGFGGNTLALCGGGFTEIEFASQLTNCNWYSAKVIIPEGFHATPDNCVLQVTNITAGTAMVETTSTTALASYDVTDITMHIQSQSTAPGAIRLASVQLAAFLEVGV
jgi:hypothetical protein